MLGVKIQPPVKQGLGVEVTSNPLSIRTITDTFANQVHVESMAVPDDLKEIQAAILHTTKSTAADV